MLELLCIALVGLGVTQGQLVDTKYGQVQGHTVTLDTGNVVNSFLGIPFAKPPVGPLRFRYPEEPDNWDGIFEAATLPSACPQNPVGLLWITHPLWDDIDEDCLTLNIFAPNDASGGPYPTMVWFHGGGYTGSANIQYPGHFLAEKGVVVVVPNYRLGGLGFASVDDNDHRGNYGMMDQVQTLQFVKENIANFGGDPQNVLIFGQSAGGSSSGLHMISQYSRDLFHKAILESGTDVAPWAVNGPGQEPHEYTKTIARQMNCTDADNDEMMDCMREVPWEAFLENSGFDCKPGYFCQGFAPVVDGAGGFLHETPLDARGRGEFAAVPTISGLCSDDGSLYTLGLIPESEEGDGFNRTEFERLLRDRLLAIFAPLIPDPDQLDDTFFAMNWFYSDWPHIDDLENNRQSFNKMITDFAFGTGADQQLKSQVTANPDQFMYIMSLLSRNAGDVFPPWMGVFHNGELPYVWGYPKLINNPAVRDDCGIVLDIVEWNQEDARWSDYVETLWTNFAKFNDPTPSPVAPPDSNPSITWPRWEVDNQRYLDFNYTMEVKENYYQQRMVFWAEYIQYVSGVSVMQDPSDLKQGIEMGVKKLASLPSDTISRSIEDFYYKHWQKRAATLGISL